MFTHAVALVKTAPTQTATHLSSGLLERKSLSLQRKCACGNHASGGECAECSKKKGLGLQTKLKVNEPGDIYEQEADWIADQVMAAPGHSGVRGATPRIQRFSGQSNGQADAAPASVDRTLASPGAPLEPALRQDMEQRFGHDFSRVRVHSGVAAEQSAREVNAHAYTVGSNIVFGAGQLAQETYEGRRLIAHELTHVVQQGNEASLSVSVPLPVDTSAEPAAEQASDRVRPGKSAGHVGSGHGTSIQRQALVPRLMPPMPAPTPWVIPQTLPFPPVFPVPHQESEPEDQRKRGGCGSPDLPLTLVSFFPGPLGQGGRVKASPLTRCPGNTEGSKPQDRFYKDQFKCIDAAGETGNWVRGHILHGETDRSGDRNLHGPGYTAANLIIIDQSLNQTMRSWIEDAVLKLVYGPLPHVLWFDAWVDSYYPGLPFFADSISVEYGPYDTRSGTEGRRWNFKQFVLGRKPPYCPAYGFAGGVFPGMAAATSSSGFQSTMKVCHRELESRAFHVAYGGVMVAINAKWVGRGPGEEAAAAEGQPEGCPRQNYRVALYKEGSLSFDQWISTSDELSTGRRVVRTWRQLDDGDYYLNILTENLDPYCCLEGDITVAPFYAPGPKSRPLPEIA